MGVPAFFRWLSEKYPKILQDVLEERVLLANPDGGLNSERIPFDASRPNPSGLETDNLYIDMNGIIHPCSHPENGPQPKTEEDMFENVCRYVDRLFRVIRPRKLLYLAIDGVAPRAKMNQQRARRFRSAQEARELAELEASVAQTIQEEDGVEIPIKKASAAWDSNVITPGTTFMIRLATYLRFYIRKRISTDKAWKDVRVILSDASVPGEGEHKIMAHVRLQRSQPGYNPNTVHVLHGLDADLIMLALATHEAHFYISREEVLFGRKSMEMQEQRQEESGFRDQQRALDEAAGSWNMQLPENANKPLARVSIPILRDYLAAEFASCLQSLPFKPSLERLIDDVVFLCFFVGNDFLPHLPSLDIRDGALDFLFNVYKRILPSLGDYITRSGGNVNLSHVDVILGEVGAIEDYVFGMKHENEERMKQMKEQNKQSRKRGDAPPTIATNTNTHAARGKAAKILERADRQSQTALQRGHQAKERQRQKLKASAKEQKQQEPSKAATDDDNLQAALAVKEALGLPKTKEEEAFLSKQKLKNEEGDNVKKEEMDESEVNGENSGEKRKQDATIKTETEEKSASKKMKTENGVGVVGDAEDEFDNDDNDNDDDVEDDEDPEKVIEATVETEVKKLKVADPAAAEAFKAKVKAAQREFMNYC